MTANPEDAQRRAANPKASVWVAASAGTGKTKVLTDRVLGLMLAGTPPRRILCLTFTKAAAAEMANRIAERLGAWASAPEEELDESLAGLLGRAAGEETRARARGLFARVLDSGMNIQTIHAFCQSLLGRFPLEAGLAPHFTVMDERDANEMLAAAKEDVLSRARGDEALALALARVTAHIHETAFSGLLGDLARDRGRLGRLIMRFGSADAAADASRRLLGLEADDTPAAVIEAASGDQAFDAPALRAAAAALDGGTDADARRAAAVCRWLAASPGDRAERFEIYATAFLANGLSTIRRTLITKKAAKSDPDAGPALEAEAARLLFVAGRTRAAVTAEATHGLLTLGEALLAAYGRHKESRALLDFDDLILKAGAFLEGQGNATWAHYKLDGGIDHILIDEAQDTNPEQWRVVKALAEEFFSGEGAHETPRTVFAVGDAKQSIFGFQGADPAAFQDMRELFAERVPAAGGTWREEDLTQSYRSTRAVLDAVDAVFARPEAADGVSGRPITHEAHRRDDGGLVELWPPVEPAPSDPPPPWKPPVERIEADSPPQRLARLISRRIQAMVSGAETLESKGRPIRPGDVMVLVRRRTGFVEALVRECKNLDVPVAGVDRMVLTEQMAVMDLVALGRFLLLPDDDLTLAAVLKGPLIGLDEERLFALAHGRRGALWRELEDRAGDDPAFEAARGELSRLLDLAGAVPPFELYSRILGAGRGRDKLLGRLGPDAEDPISEFLDLALAFERTHVPSLEGFLHWLEAGAVEVKRDPEQETRDTVRVMTVHGAKGLQSPIVFLPDTMQVPRAGPRLLWTEDGLLLWPPARAFHEEVAEGMRAQSDQLRDREYRRLLYVAMTRAEDRLYVCGWRTRQSPPEGCWYNLVRDGLADLPQTEELAAAYLGPEIRHARVLRLSCPQKAEAKPGGGGKAEP
ncbi:MAG: double-strand break repair helicase AddA, partial [Proteobacteria bacterium]|nr:double-strand break repair helicase AddA [Pseudomonadota bacterium]